MTNIIVPGDIILKTRERLYKYTTDMFDAYYNNKGIEQDISWVLYFSTYSALYHKGHFFSHHSGYSDCSYIGDSIKTVMYGCKKMCKQLEIDQKSSLILKSYIKLELIPVLENSKTNGMFGRNSFKKIPSEYYIKNPEDKPLKERFQCIEKEIWTSIDNKIPQDDNDINDIFKKSLTELKKVICINEWKAVLI